MTRSLDALSEVRLRCGDCGAVMALKRGIVKGNSRIFYGCSRFPKCRGTVSAHQATGFPSGTPADAETRRLRVAAHWHFDKLWKRGLMTRTEAYAWLRTTLGVSEDEAHIGELSGPMCEVVIVAAKHAIAAGAVPKRGGAR